MMIEAITPRNRVAEVRRGLGMSRERLAAEAGLSFRSLLGMEDPSRNLTLRSLNRLARALGVPPGELIA